ncbi:MAG: hypothetical protein J6T82_00115 [Bacteroidaceae bacterium]|nr:hypothetical protein [Bacteroidaceae bacterium]
MKVKKEVFESLRLELQEFTPQEFVAVCYVVTVNCSSEGHISTQKSNNTGFDHSGGHLIMTIYFHNQTPSNDLVKSKLGTLTNGYTGTARNTMNKANPGYIVNYNELLSTGHFYKDNQFTTSTFPDSNVSG